jgi:hypothetical protein
MSGSETVFAAFMPRRAARPRGAPMTPGGVELSYVGSRAGVLACQEPGTDPRHEPGAIGISGR